MKIELIGEGFRRDVGQGVDKYCRYLAIAIRKIKDN